MVLQKLFAPSIFSIFIGLIGLGISSVAFSQSLTMPKVTETYVGGSVMFDIDNRLEGSSTTGSFNNTDVDKARTLMLRWGYREEQTYAIELGYMYTANWKARSQNGSTANQKSHGLFADLLFFFPVMQDLSAYVKMGVGRIKTTGTIKTNNTTVSVKQTKWAPNYGIGVEYQMSPAFAIRGGWEQFTTNADYFGKAEHKAITLGGILIYE